MHRLLMIAVLLVPVEGFAQQEASRQCTPEGVWYGGSRVAYQMTITPSRPAGEYIVTFEGMYKNSVLNTAFTGRVVRRGSLFEGSVMQLSTADPDFLNPPPIGKMPNLFVGWTSIRMIDCDTIENTIPFFGIYFAGGLWAPGIIWDPLGKVPMLDPPDVDLVVVLNGGAPIVESYRRLPNSVNPALLHKP